MSQELTPKQLQAVRLIAQGKTQQEVAQILDINRKTIQRWIKIPEFAQAITNVHSRSVEKTIERSSEELARHTQDVIQKLVPKALMVIHEYLTNPSAKGSDRLRAVHIVGSWAGLNQLQVKQEQAPEQNLKDYVNYLAANKNGTNNNASN